MTYKGIAKGNTIELEEQLPFPEGQPVTVSVELLTSQHPPGSPATILEAISQLPHLDPEDVDALERAIEESRLPIREERLFDDEP